MHSITRIVNETLNRTYTSIIFITHKLVKKKITRTFFVATFLQENFELSIYFTELESFL